MLDFRIVLKLTLTLPASLRGLRVARGGAVLGGPAGYSGAILEPSASDRALVGHAPQPIAIRRRHQLGATDQVPTDLLGLPIVRHLVDGREHVSAQLVQHRRDGAAPRLLVHGPNPCHPNPLDSGVYPRFNFFLKHFLAKWP